MPKTVLITGASSGIGAALADLLADKGYALILHGRDGQRLDDVVLKVSKKSTVDKIQADLSTEEGRKSLCEKIKNSVPELVINNAGLGWYGDVTDQPWTSLKEIIDVNIEAVVELTQAAAQIWKEKKIEGIVLNVSSVAAYTVMPGLAVYAATKSFVNQFSVSMDFEMKEHGIRVLASCPGVVATNFSERAGADKKRKNPMEMTVEFAANEIWKQVEKKKRVHLFDWKYRVLGLLSYYVLPRFIVARETYSAIKKLIK